MTAVDFVCYSFILEVWLPESRVVIEQSTCNSPNRKDIIKRFTQVESMKAFIFCQKISFYKN